MNNDRISFAKKASAEEGLKLAKEICIIRYFDELMALYNLIVSDNDFLISNTIKNYWFDDNDQRFNMTIEFKGMTQLNRFCNDIQYYGGIISIYGMSYKICCDFDPHQPLLCKVHLDLLQGQPNPS